MREGKISGQPVSGEDSSKFYNYSCIIYCIYSFLDFHMECSQYKMGAIYLSDSVDS
jgi:hypothetical protein